MPFCHRENEFLPPSHYQLTTLPSSLRLPSSHPAIMPPSHSLMLTLQKMLPFHSLTFFEVCLHQTLSSLTLWWWGCPSCHSSWASWRSAPLCRWRKQVVGIVNLTWGGGLQYNYSKPVWQRLSTDSLKFHLGLPCPTLLRPAGGPPP
jgi:hypothetical protein